MKTIKKEKLYEKYAWIIFALISLIILAGGIPHMFGTNTDPALVKAICNETIEALQDRSPLQYDLYHFYFKSGGLSDIGVAFFLMIITIFGYRKNEKWAWFALWFVPAFFIFYIIVSLSLPADAQNILVPPLVVFTVLSIIGMLLPLRKFFPKKQTDQADL